MTKCRGCGVILQDKDIDKLGYTEDLGNNLCRRCFRLTNYGEYSGVSLTNDDFTKLLDTIPKNSLVVYTSDILSLNVDRINNYNNLVLVITKRDIMPKSIKDEKIINYIKNTTSVKDVIIISSKKNYNIDKMYNYICNFSNGMPVYFVGDTNSGKSTLINKLIKNYGNNNQDNVTVSMYPSTTLSMLSIKLDKITIIDTPGIIDKRSIINYVDKNSLKKIIPVKEIKPKSCQIMGKGSIVINDFLRIDYDTDIKNSVVIYASNSLNIRFNSLKNTFLKELSVYDFSVDSKKDVVIPGLCFIKITKPIKLKIYTYENVVPYLRNNLI